MGGLEYFPSKTATCEYKPETEVTRMSVEQQTSFPASALIRLCFFVIGLGCRL